MGWVVVALLTTNPWTYATGYHDAANGYLKLGACYYNPTTARFTQPDWPGRGTDTEASTDAAIMITY